MLLQYLDLESGLYQLCPTGRELSMLGCLPCSATCKAGEYVQGACDGSQATNAVSCVPCTLLNNTQCLAASTLPVKRASQTIVYSASQFRSDCTDRRGLDCMRRQALMYPFDGNDLLEDLAPWARRLEAVSASGRSDGPSLELLLGSSSSSSGSGSSSSATDCLLNTVLKSSFHRRTVAANLNASNHEYYRIPTMANVFDPSLAVRVVLGSRTLQGGQRRIASTLIWEQVMELQR